MSRFSDGCWRENPGYHASYAAEVYDIRADERSITVFATTRQIQSRSMMLGGPALEIRFSSTLENVIKVTVDHHRGQPRKGPFFVLHEDAAFCPTVEQLADGRYVLISGKTRVTVAAQGEAWSVAYDYDGKRLTGQSRRSTSYVEEETWRTQARRKEQARAYFYADSETDESAWMREMLDISVGESIYGFGEKFTPFVKNGQHIEVWNNDGGTSSEQSYKSIPFYVSSRGYGCFVNHSEMVSFDVASVNVERVMFMVQGEHLEYFVIGGASIADVISNYTTLTGKPALPPPFSFGLWLTTSFTTDYDEATCTHFIDEMQRREIPLEVFHFDCFWMRDFHWCDFIWDPRTFPDPKAMLRRLKDKGVKICVWINPYVSQQSQLFDEGVANGYFIKKKDGSVFHADLWQPSMAIVDFTNPAAREWYADQLRALCEMGVDAFKTDFGERIPTDVVYFDGSDPYKMHNYYAQIYNQTVFDVLKDYYGENHACLFARAATAGGQQFPVHWGGDCSSTYESMWETIRGGLSLCLSGFGFFSHDISGFERTATPDLYKRWSAFGLMSSHSRLHGNISYRVPWNFDEESCDVLRHFTKLKGRLMPYLFANAVKAHKTGVPMMRAMVMEYADDPATHTLDRQYMFGDALLVAPVFREDGVCAFYLPDVGVWTDIQTGETLEGGKWYEKQYDYFHMPLFAKPNSIIVYGDFKRSFAYDYDENATAVIYGLSDGATAETTLYDKSAKRETVVTATRNGDTIRVTTSDGRHIHAVSVQGLRIED